MSVFSVNQTTHFYVVPTVNDCSVAKDGEGNLFFTLKNADGEALRSDLLTNITYVKATPASAMARTKNAVKISMSSNPVAGTQYILGIRYRQWVAPSEEVTYFEMADAVAESTTKKTFLAKMAVNLAKNTEKQGLVEIRLYDGTDETLVTATSTVASLTGTYTEIHIVEKEQPWKLGVMPQTTVLLEPEDIKCSWGTVADLVPAGAGDVIGNGKTIADMEYFYIGFRGDVYRDINWPLSTPSKGLADPATTYDVLNIHYSFKGFNQEVQVSEKDLVIVAPSASHTVMNDIITKINTATGATSDDPNYIAALV